MEKLTLLVVDDSIITSKRLAAQLEELGHSVVAFAHTGEEAVEAYKEHQPDMVTMDITMPDMNGIEATRHILKEDADALIVMVTSHGQEQMVIEAIEAGAKGYVMKPVKMAKLQEHLEQVVLRYRG